MDNAEMPIVAKDGKKPNDTFIEQLQLNAEAAINKLADLGVGDKKRMAVGGHSYGAFMTANLLAHTNLFAAGIARSGAYNRTLTPFGFQNEERTYWQVPQLYYAMSPFSYADKIKTPILLIHGDSDDNPQAPSRSIANDCSMPLKALAELPVLYFYLMKHTATGERKTYCTCFGNKTNGLKDT